MATLLAIRGPLTGARFGLNEEATRIGRAPQSDILLQDATVSRVHAIIRKHRNGWLLEDCESAAGTFVNGRQVKTAVALAPNDEVRIGATILLFDSDFDLQNADFTDNSVYISQPNDDTLALTPVATLEPVRDLREVQARAGVEFLTELGDLFDSTRVPFGEALRSTMERMAAMMKSDSAVLMLYDHGTRQLRASAVVARGDVLADRSVLMKVFTEHRALLLSDRPELVNHPAPGAPAAPKVRSLMAAPLLVEESCLGIAYFERQELDAYTLKDLRMLQSLARLLAVFIEIRQRAEAVQLRTQYQAADSPVVGSSVRFRRTMELVRRVADTQATVLLVGETGTGKEVIAAEVHRLSSRGRDGRPYVAVNCAAIPESLFEAELFGHEKGAFTGAHKLRQGYIEQAQGGTLFLDEIGELSLSLQPKLLRFLQEHTFTRVGGNRVHRAEVRVICATNRSLEAEVKAGRFREDLFHRISVLPVEVPPLRERREDIRLLAQHFLALYTKQMRTSPVVGISDEALIVLEKYDWPGNVRELANCMERAVLLCDERVLLPRHFSLGRGPSFAGRPTVAPIATGPTEDPTRLLGAPPSEKLRTLEEVEREHILKVMEAMGNNQVRAAEVLGIHRNTLRKKLQDWGILNAQD